METGVTYLHHPQVLHGMYPVEKFDKKSEKSWVWCDTYKHYSHTQRVDNVLIWSRVTGTCHDSLARIEWMF